MSATHNNPLWRILDIRFKRRHAIAAAGTVLAAVVIVVIMQFITSDNFITAEGAVLGGDFSAFWGAAKGLAAGHGLDLYDPVFFREWLEKIAPPYDNYNLAWQYPPPYYFVIAPLAVLPYGPAWLLWTGGSLVIFGTVARQYGVRGMALFMMIAAPVTFQAAITGQNGFFTASLLAGAGFFAPRRPMLAGLCAAALTMKPQLGLLIPFAFAAAGCWRAFAWAAVGAAVLAAASLAMFGVDMWAGFFETAIGASARTANGVMPLFKMPTVFSLFLQGGAQAPAAYAIHGLIALAALALTITVWRRSARDDFRLAVLCLGVFLTAPYALYYELIILALPITLIAVNARETGWLAFEQVNLAALFLAPMFLPGERGMNLGLAVVILAGVFIIRRVLHDEPDILVFNRGQLKAA